MIALDVSQPPHPPGRRRYRFGRVLDPRRGQLMMPLPRSPSRPQGPDPYAVSDRERTGYGFLPSQDRQEDKRRTPPS
jgi:hypothetical protein